MEFQYSVKPRKSIIQKFGLRRVGITALISIYYAYGLKASIAEVIWRLRFFLK